MFRHLLHENTLKIHWDIIDRDEAIKELVGVLPNWCLTADQKERITHLLLRRENYGTTAIGDEIALPHATLPELPGPLAVLGFFPGGVDYPSLDGNRVRVIFLLVMPQSEDAEQEKQRILYSAHRFFSDRFIRQKLMMAQSSEAAYQLLTQDVAFDDCLLSTGSY